MTTVQARAPLCTSPPGRTTRRTATSAGSTSCNRPRSITLGRASLVWKAARPFPYRGSDGALPFLRFHPILHVLAQVDVVLRLRVFRADSFQVREALSRPGDVQPAEEGGRRLSLGPLGPIEVDQPVDGVRYSPRGNSRRHLPELRSPVVDGASDHDEVLGNDLVAQPAGAPLESDASDVVATATVRTATDLDLEVRRRSDEVRPGPEVLSQEPPEAARLRHGEPAGLRPGAAGDVGDRPGIGQPEAAR